MKFIKRHYYLENLINVKDVPDTKIIIGIRRSGKVYFSYCDFKKLEETGDNYTT